MNDNTCTLTPYKQTSADLDAFLDECDKWHQQHKDTQQLTNTLTIAFEWLMILALVGVACWVWWAFIGGKTT